MGKINLIGQEFGRLKVIDKAPSKNGRGMQLCQCSCGNQKIVRTDALKDGRTKSCGCLTKERLYEARNHIEGQVFGKLTVIRELDERNPNTRGILQECQCQCGQKIITTSTALKTKHIQSCGCMKSQGEFYIGQILTENHYKFKKEKTFNDCIFPDSGAKAKFDFQVNDEYIIEFDGLQHFKGSGGSGQFTEETHKKTVEHDIFKNQYCKNHNIPIIRIPYSHLEKICLEDLCIETSKFLC